MHARPIPFAILVTLLAAAAATAAPKEKPSRKPDERQRLEKLARRRGPGVYVHPAGLDKDVQTLLAVYKGKRCLRRTRIGSFVQTPPGTYEVRVGFPSGWVAQEITVPKDRAAIVPTGCFRFAEVTGKETAGSVPQKLYHGETYLMTGYQGQAVRLVPGTYTVRYHLPEDVAPALAVTGWHRLGPFPIRWKNKHPVDKPYAVEKRATIDFSKPVVEGKQKWPWRKVEGGRSLNLHPGKMGFAGMYHAAVLDVGADDAGPAELMIHARPPVRAFLNGERIVVRKWHRRAYRPELLRLPVTLKAGGNLLLVKSAASKSGRWPLSVTIERWRSYEVTVTENLGPTPAKLPRVRKASAKAAPGPLEGVEGLVFVQVPHGRGGRSGLHGEQFRIVRRPNRSNLATLIPAGAGGKVTDLTGEHFAAAINPDLSYDGRRVIFSARRPGKGRRWNVYEMTVDGTGLRQITRDHGDCFDPYYLPDGRILFSSNNVPFRDEYDRDRPPLLHACDADGSNVERLSFNLSSDTHGIVMDDGRVLFNSWQHHGDHEGVAGNFSLCTVLPDGTGFNLFTGNDARADRMSRTMGYPQQLADGRVVFVETAGHRMYNGGSLTAVHPRKPLTTREVLTPGIVFSGHNLAGRYASPYPLPGGGMLVAYSPGRCTALLREDPAEDPRLGLYVFDFDAGRPGRLLFDDPASQDYDPLAICERPTPPVVPRMVIPGRKTGVMFCVNAYLNDRADQSKYATVGRLPPAKPGEIAGVRVTEGFGVEDTDRRYHKPIVIDMLQMSFGSGSNGGNNFEQKRIVGYAPVEADGSFNIEVPADTVLSLQTLDANGMAIETQLTWTWVRPGETRMCVGCHEDREQALPNTDCLAMQRPADFVAPPPQQRRTVDFRRDIMPIIARRCSPCHDGRKKEPAGGLDLRPGFELVFHRSGHTGRAINGAFFNHAYESLLQAPPNRVGTLVISGAAKYSPLIWRLWGRKLTFTDVRNPYKKPIKRMPPGKPLSDEEKRLFVEWVDLGAQWDNIPGEDDLPGYDAVASAKLAKEIAARLKKPIAAPAEAFEVRCLDCHDSRRLKPLKTLAHSKVPALVRRMAAKRKGWIHDSELPLIIRHIRAENPEGKGK